MTERLRAHPYAASHHGEARRASVSGDEGLSAKKTMLVLVVVIGCFAVLWPKLFYPMLVNNANSQMKPGPVDKTTGCCDVISELDLETLNIMSELCSTIIDTSGKIPPSPKEIVTQCRKAVLETCGIDISAALQDRIVSLGHSVKQILEEVRSLNGSLCLKYNFGLSSWRLGVPHRVNIHLDPLNSIKQERPTHMRSEMVHPAFKERGRAIPQSDPSGIPRRSNPPPRIVEGRPGPIPGMRPAMGGPGHMVAPSKHSNYGFMGVLMPVYTIGFVVFFTYTVMKLVFKKKTEDHVGAPLYPPCEPDERFHKEVFEANKGYFHRPSRDSSKIGDEELSQLRIRLRETELAMERIVEQMTQVPLVTQDETEANGFLPKEDEQGTVKVMGMETTASCENGKKWSRPDSPVLPHPHPVPPKEPSAPPQQIFLEGSLPPQSQILVAEAATETQKDSEDDSPVVLAGKMTLSVISLDSDTGTEDSSNSRKKVLAFDEERRRSSSNISDDFEKMDTADLEDQINNILKEAENIAMTEENRYSLNEELDKFEEENHQAPQINEKDRDNDVLEEIKNQLNLEDDLLLALKKKEPEGKVSLPVTDIIKEFLNNEENALLAEAKEIQIDDIRKEDIDILDRDKLSLKAEDSEFELNEELDEANKILNIMNNEIENSTVSSKNNLEDSEKQEQSIKAEESANDNKLVNKPVDDTGELSQIDNEKVSEELDSVKTQTNVVLEKELIRDLYEKNETLSESSQLTKEEAVTLSNQETNLSKEELQMNTQEKQEQSIKAEESANDDKLVDEPVNDNKELDGNAQTDELSQKGNGEVFEELDSVKTQTNVVLEEKLIDVSCENNETLSESSQLKKEEAVTLPNKETNLSEDELQMNTQNVVTESEIIQEERPCSIQKVVDLEYLNQQVSKENENYENNANQNREKSPEESNGSNKADLLLQGLIVKHDVELNDPEYSAKVILGEILKDPKIDVIENDKTDSDKQKQNVILSHSDEEEHTVQSDVSPRPNRSLPGDSQAGDNATIKEKISETNLATEDKSGEGSSRIIDEDGLIDDEDYDYSEDELIDDEVRDINREVYEDRRESKERRINGNEVGSPRNGAANTGAAAENEISEEEDLENDDDDEEIEEIIEYVDNTDEEGEEIVEVNGNEHIQLYENGEN